MVGRGVTVTRERSRPTLRPPRPLPRGDHPPARRAPWWITGSGAIAVVLAGIGAVLATVGDAPTKDPGALAMNLVIVATFPVVAAVVAHHRPGHRIVWVFGVVALGAAATVFTYGYARYGLQVAPGSLPGATVMGWASTWVWVAGVMPLVTFGLLLFPDGRLPSRRWWPVAAIAAGGMIAMGLSFALRPGPLVDHPIVDNPYGVSGSGRALESLEEFGFGLFALAFLASVASLGVRWRRGGPRERRQLRWLMFSAVVLAAAFVEDGVIDSGLTSWLAAAALGFLPLAVGVAIVRERLYDIDRLISRSVVYGTLTAGVVATYAAVVTLVAAVIGGRADFVGPLLATGVVAVAFQPAREVLQRQVSRLVYGAAADPYTALARLARSLEATIGPTSVLPVVVDTVATTLRLPYVAIELVEDGSFRSVASHGRPETAAMTRLQLTHQGHTIGRIVLGDRASGEPLTETERRLLEDLVRQAGLAVHGVRLTSALQRSRERLVVTREEERRRLHRDLHDGLGPTLAAMMLQLDVLRRQIVDDPQGAEAQVAHFKEQLQGAIHEIRRLVEALRPPALDELGLVASLRQQALAIGAPAATATGLSVTVESPEALPRMGPATEVAAYRIVMEAMTNVVRHAAARNCVIRLTCADLLEVEVEDDGRGIPAQPQLGVGLTSMRERAAELGGHCSIEPGVEGGTRVHARLPLGAR